MYDGPPTCSEEYDPTCWNCRKNRSIHTERTESRRKAWVSRQARARATYEPGCLCLCLDLILDVFFELLVALIVG